MDCGLFVSQVAAIKASPVQASFSLQAKALNAVVKVSKKERTAEAANKLREAHGSHLWAGSGKLSVRDSDIDVATRHYYF